MSNKCLLEVDDSIITKNLLLSDNNKEDEFSELMKTFNKTEKPSTLVRPTPGACVKAKTESGDKIFINICLTTEIPAPENISEMKLLEILQDGTQTNYRIPMSIGQERIESDKSGVPSSTYDVAINTEFFKKCKDNKFFWAFMITVAIEGVSDKFDKRICTDGYVVLKHRKAMGKLQDHRIEKREVNNAMRRPIIEELTDKYLGPSDLETETIISSDNAQNEKKPAVNYVSKIKKPQYRILREPKEGEVTRLVGQFKIQNLLSAKDLIVDVGKDRIIVETRKSGYLVDIFVPYSIEQENVSAVLDKNVGMLTLNMPVGRS